MMNGFKARTEKKKQAVIDAARELFSQKGISPVSITDIAQKSGVSHVSIYNYFGSKKELAILALISYFDEAIKNYEEMLEQNIPFAEKVEKIMDYKYAKISHLGKSFFSLSALEDEEFKEVIREAAYVKAVPIYTRFIEQGKKEGFIAREIPTQTILTFIFQIMPILECKDYQESSEENKRGILNLILYGIIGRKPG